MRSGTFLRYWLPVLVMMGFIFLASTDTFSSANTFSVIKPIIRFFDPAISKLKLRTINNAIRKSAHLSEYFVLGLVLFRAFRSGRSEKGIILRSAFLSVLIVALYSGTDELHQAFTATRGPEVMDVGIDTLGGALAQVVSMIRLR